MKILALLITCISLIGLASASGTCSINQASVCALSNNSLISDQANESSICVYFFYGNGCPHCANIEPFIAEIAGKYPVSIKPLEVYYNNTNQALFNDFNNRYGVLMNGVPSVFIGDKALIGEDAIRNNLESIIQYYMINTPVCPEEYKKYESGLYGISPSTNIELTIPLVIVSALIDSINPCAFAVLTFLLVYLLELGNRKRLLKVGVAYITTIFIVYFMSGLGLFMLVQSTGMTRLVYTLAALVSIIAGAINLKDYFWYGKGITLAIPEKRKPLLKKFMKEATIPAAVVLGVLVSLFELPCTGGAYLAILGLLSNKMTIMAGIPYLLFYNLIFVTPLILILLVIYKGLPPERVHKWRLQNRKYLRLAMGLVMIGLGIIMLIQ